MASQAADPGPGDPETDSPAPLSADLRTDTRRVIPGHHDVVVAEAARVIGGPSGAHAAIGRSRHWTPIRVLFLLALCTLALGWFGKAGCLQQEAVVTGPDGATTLELDRSDQRQFTDLCYSDVIALYGAERLDKGAFPYRTYWFEDDGNGETIKRYMEYPVITGMYMYVVAKGAQAWSWAMEHWGVPGALESVLFFDLAALGLVLFWLVTIWATALTARARIWAAWVAAVSPLVIVHAFTNFDAIATAMLAVAMLCWARRRPWLAGVFIGLGAAAKFYPVLLLVVLFLLCLRSGRLRTFAQTAIAAVVTWLVVNLPILTLYPRGWYEFFRLNSERGADSDSLLRLAAKAVGTTWDVPILNIVSFGLMILLVIGIAVLALAAPTRPRVAQLMFLLVAGFLLLNKVWSPQYSLWLVPLAVLAIPHTRLLLAWMAVDALVWIPRMSLYIDPSRRWLPQEWFTAIIVIRALFVIVLCVIVIWQILRPEEDLMRRDGEGNILDDPAGGVLDGASDRIGAHRPRVAPNGVPLPTG
ncbi:glycosyltransferase family 87 protein [Gordonia desulfuricans]|uniref:glycosyltransferase family 87 protein n=1 Tax=Gordonia desulfuricans TaxID=89051 RepID=UPI00073E4CE5|nr:glycosyltransferase 87 family protein [Gordonia desulfuricans]